MFSHQYDGTSDGGDMQRFKKEFWHQMRIAGPIVAICLGVITFGYTGGWVTGTQLFVAWFISLLLIGIGIYAVSSLVEFKEERKTAVVDPTNQWIACSQCGVQISYIARDGICSTCRKTHRGG